MNAPNQGVTSSAKKFPVLRPGEEHFSDTPSTILMWFDLASIMFGHLVGGRIVEGPVVEGKSMRAAVFRGPYDIGVEDVPVPEVGKYEVILKVGASSICTSDIHSYHGMPNAEYPRIPGHEVAGVAVNVGEGVKNVKVGERLSPDEDTYTCGKCDYCLADRSNLCSYRVGSLGSFGIPGGFAEYVRVPVAPGGLNLHKIPDNVSFEEASVNQTVAVSYHGVVDLGKVQAGDFVVVIGDGSIGLGAVAVAKALGANVLCSGHYADRLEVARKMGADYVVNAKQEDLTKRVMSLTSGKGADEVFECVGGNQVETAMQSVQVAKTAGRFVNIGNYTNEPRTLQMPDFYTWWWVNIERKELECTGVRGSNRRIGATLKLISEGKINVDPMITHALPLKDVKRGYELMDKKLENAIKVVLRP